MIRFLAFSSLGLTLIALLFVPALTQESDFAVKRDFEDRAAALKARIDASTTTVQLDSLKNDLDGFELDFQKHSPFLDKALYPETFASRMKDLRDLYERTTIRVQTIQAQGTQIAAMEGTIQVLTYRLDTLTAQRDRLFIELQQNKANVAALRETVRRLQTMLQAQDKLVFALVDSIFMPYGKDLAKVSDVQRDALNTKLTGNNLIGRVYGIASDNIHFLEATELQGKDFASLLEHYQQFDARWKGLSEKIQAVATASQTAQSKGITGAEGTGLAQGFAGKRGPQTVQIDSLLGLWNARLRTAFWSAVGREFSSRGVQLKPFSDAPGFSTCIRSYVQSLQTSGEDPSLFVNEIWKARIDKEWREALSRDGMLGKEEYSSLDKLVSELARTRIDTKFVLYVGIVALVAFVLWWFLARKPKVQKPVDEKPKAPGTTEGN
jgi:hypothetical protein